MGSAGKESKLSRPTKFENLIAETSELVSVQATRLYNACHYRPETEVKELMAIASSLRRLHSRVAKRAQNHEERSGVNGN